MVTYRTANERTNIIMKPQPPRPQRTTTFEVNVSKDTFKFNAAHFVAFPGFRERLHGHNYRVGVRLLCDRQIGADGYVIDFGCVKDVCKKVCKRLNEHFICPQYSDVLQIEHENGSVRIECEDGAVFVFPRQDCCILPLVHATTEELSIYLWAEILNGLNADYLIKRGIHTMEVTVAESVGQESTFRLEIPPELEGKYHLDVRKFITKSDIVPMPCETETRSASPPLASCSPQSKAPKTDFSAKLEKLAQALNDGSLQDKDSITAKDLQSLIN